MARQIVFVEVWYKANSVTVLVQSKSSQCGYWDKDKGLEIEDIGGGVGLEASMIEGVSARL
jgi:hypothetical protein